MCILVYVCMLGCMHEFVYVDVQVFMSICDCMVQRYGPACEIRTGNRKPEPDLNLCSSWTRYTGDSKINPWDDSEVSTSSVVKTRRRFGSKTVSFHVSICFHIVSLSIVASRYHVTIRIISCDYLIYFTSMITRTISYDISECSLYLYS